MRKRVIALMVCMMLVVTTVCGCGGGSSSNQSKGGNDSKIFRFGLEGDVVSLDPLYSYSFSTSTTVSQMLESWYTYVDNEMVPTLATGYTVSEDGLTYVFTFRDDVTFWDGTKMTAEDVVYSMERIIDPDNGGYTAWMHASVADVEATGEYEVTVTLSAPDATWIYATATNACSVISKEYCEANKDKFGTAEGGIMGTGAYKYKSWTSGQEVVMVKNENYWDKENQPYFDEVHFYIFADATTRLVALQSGELDATYQVPSSQKEMVSGTSGINLNFVDSVSTSAFYMNCQREPFNDENVRKAVSCLFDKESFNKGVSSGTASVGESTFLPEALRVYGDDKWSEFFETVTTYEYSIDKAKEYLSQSAYPEGFTATITIASGDNVQKSAALYLQEAAAEIGITFKIEEVTASELTSKLFSAERDYDLIHCRWDADFPEPSTDLIPTLLSANTVAGGGNFANYKNPEVDALLTEQLALSDDSERLDKILEASAIVAEDAPYLIYEYPLRGIATWDYVTGYEPSPFFLWEPFTKYLSFKTE